MVTGRPSKAKDKDIHTRLFYRSIIFTLSAGGQLTRKIYGINFIDPFTVYRTKFFGIEVSVYIPKAIIITTYIEVSIREEAGLIEL